MRSLSGQNIWAFVCLCLLPFYSNTKIPAKDWTASCQQGDEKGKKQNGGR